MAHAAGLILWMWLQGQACFETATVHLAYLYAYPYDLDLLTFVMLGIVVLPSGFEPESLP